MHAGTSDDVPGETAVPTARDGEVLALPDGGLTAAVEALAAAQPVPVALGVDVPAGLRPAVELAAYRAVESALAAVVATGTSRATVVVTYDDGLLRVEVADDAHRARTTEVPTR
jgi:signal transduction histidine kinase